MVLVDTNILAYLTIHGDQTPLAQALYERDADWRSETFILVEYANVLATYIRAGALTPSQGTGLLVAAESLMPILMNVPHARALGAAAEYKISAYDARFIAVARQTGVKLVTEDARLRTAVPAWTQSMKDALA